MYQLDFDTEYSSNTAINSTGANNSASVASCAQYSSSDSHISSATLGKVFSKQSATFKHEGNPSKTANILPAPKRVTTPEQKGSLSELRMASVSAINPSLVLPLLASAANDERWLLWLSERAAVKSSKSEETQVAELPVIHMTIHAESQWLLTLRAINSGNHHVCVEWQGVLTNDQRDSLREAAEQAGSHLFVICRDH